MPEGRQDESIVLLFDVDDTLFDNDRFSADLDARIRRDLGAGGDAAYRRILEALRAEMGYVDYLGALQRLRLSSPHEPSLPALAAFMLEYPFGERLYPQALEILARARTWGTPVILSDGDIVFQPLKIRRSGLWEAVNGRVVLSIHKEHELGVVETRYPAPRYVVIDDKLAILTAVKRVWASRATTVFVRQGHYAHDPQILASNPPADLTVAAIGDLLAFDRSAFARRSGSASRGADHGGGQ